MDPEKTKLSLDILPLNDFQQSIDFMSKQNGVTEFFILDPTESLHLILATLLHINRLATCNV